MVSETALWVAFLGINQAFRLKFPPPVVIVTCSKYLSRLMFLSY